MYGNMKHYACSQFNFHLYIVTYNIKPTSFLIALYLTPKGDVFMKIKELLTDKKEVITATDSVMMLDAIKTMCNARVGALLVINANTETVGIITERDVLRFCANRAHELDKVPISQAMTTNLIVVTEDASIDEVMSIMTEHKFRHMPIVEAGGKIIAMVSMGDLVKAKLEQTAVEAKYLRDYINA